MPDLIPAPPWPAGWSALLFLLAGAVTVVASIVLVRLGDALADRTGWGEALFGVVFFGLATSLSGIVVTVVTTASGAPQLGYGNAVGGIAAQTTAVAVADLCYRRVNLEHASASLSNLLIGCLLIAMLGLALLGTFSPQVSVAWLHPVSLALVGCYLGGLRLVRTTGVRPMWEAVQTAETRPDVPHEHGRLDGRRTGHLWSRFVVVAVVVTAGGWVNALAAESLVEVTGLSAGFVGGILLGVVNALPETVTAIAAVRRGAITLAVAAVLGGNTGDTLNLVIGDLAYRDGSLYHAAGNEQLFLTAAGIFMTATLLGGLLVRQGRGWGRVGFEGVIVLATYVVVLAVLAA